PLAGAEKSMIKQERDDCEDRRNARPHACGRPPRQTGRSIRDRANAAGSEISRPGPVDLEADADLNEGRGGPGHCSSSLAFPTSNKLDRGTPPRKPRNQTGGNTHAVYSAREFYCRPPLGSR